ncbi:MAG TPA: zinc ribbon domain-containing protein [Chloroflexota bacterium]|jgi:hypothetical protein|nr:zinc ribbon domain-containing protein [Chloroflexota bacterium]
MELAPARVRAVHIGSLASAIVLLLLGVLVLTGPSNGSARLLVILLLLVLLGVQLWLFIRERRAPLPADAGWQEEVAPVQGQEQRIVIRCKQCGEVFPVEDTGERPLATTCPHCGKTGSIKVRSHA